MEGDTAQARADRTMAELKAGIRVVQPKVEDAGEADGGDDEAPQPE